MYCSNMINNEECGKCQYSILSDNFIYSKSLINIARIMTNISWMNEFKDTNDITVSKIKSININCYNHISIIKVDNNRFIDISVLKHICTRLFDKWYKYHASSKRLNNYEYIMNKLNCINDTNSILQIRTILLSIAKYTD